MRPLTLIDGIMNALVYRDILDGNMLPHAQENDPKHISFLLKTWLCANFVQVLKSFKSPDINPIEHV